MDTRDKKLKTRVENVLKRRKTKDKAALIKARKAAEARKKRRKQNHGWFKRAEQFIKETRRSAADVTRLSHMAKNPKKSPVSDDAIKLLLVARVKGLNGHSAKVKKMLKVLRLGEVNTAVFVQNTPANRRMLQLLDPFVIYGMPSLRTIRDLIYKRGYGRLDDEGKIPLNDNAKIEKCFGKHDVICVEDLVHEITTIGPAFTPVTKFLYPFQLQAPMGGWKKKGIHFLDEGEIGYVGEKIDEFIAKVC